MLQDIFSVFVLFVACVELARLRERLAVYARQLALDARDFRSLADIADRRREAARVLQLRLDDTAETLAEAESMVADALAGASGWQLAAGVKTPRELRKLLHSLRHADEPPST